MTVLKCPLTRIVVDSFPLSALFPVEDWNMRSCPAHQADAEWTVVNVTYTEIHRNFH